MKKNNQQKHPLTLLGEVVANQMGKTAVVKVSRRFPHPLYHRPVSRSKKYLVDCREVAIKVGDTVRIQNCRPLSSRKRWKIIKKVEKK